MPSNSFGVRNKNEKRYLPMEKELPKIRSVHMTSLYLSVPKNLQKFLSEFRQILKNNFQIITIEGEKRYTCGQEHTRLNPNWEPFKHLERYSLEQGLEFWGQGFFEGISTAPHSLWVRHINRPEGAEKTGIGANVWFGFWGLWLCGLRDWEVEKEVIVDKGIYSCLRDHRMVIFYEGISENSVTW